MYDTLSEAENNFLRHISRWGSSGYPIQKLSSGKWIWNDCWGCKGAPTVYKTQREVTEAIERYHQSLLDRAGEEARKRSV